MEIKWSSDNYHTSPPQQFVVINKLTCNWDTSDPVARTFDRRLRERGLIPWQPLRLLPHICTHWQTVLGMFDLGSHWLENCFQRCFEPSPDDQWKCVWRRQEQQWNTHLTMSCHTTKQPEIIFLGAISFNSISPLWHPHSTALSRRYSMPRCVVLHFTAQHFELIFQQDNAGRLKPRGNACSQ